MKARLLTALVVTASVTCVGCSTGDSRPVGGDVPIVGEKVGVDVFHGDKFDLVDYVTNKLIGDCMAGQGYPQLRDAGITPGSGAFSGLNLNGPEFARVDLDHAERTGFGHDQKPTGQRVISNDPGFDKANEACRAEANGKVGGEYFTVLGQMTDLFNQMSGEHQNRMSSGDSADELAPVLDSLVSCLERSGLRPVKPGERTLAAFRVGVPQGHLTGPEPAQPKRVPGTVEVLPPQPARKYVPTPEESKTAVAALNCANELGYREKVASVQSRELRRLIGANETALRDLTARIDGIAGEAAKLVNG
ncbi:hypothetical protein [Actinokineospora iranica]|uniref:Uncharacterized protein n=1 Tax=Actinokineospora iranica TaxID=1271860 RepID=A0A1G6TA61_9PSEU|nr:hypothetical protein [Actinokineospora iranica]SDD25941.1 hypothetical protein SAMN05216174_10947 [Actinokineospora iranica]